MSVTLTTENVLEELRKAEARASEAFAAVEKLKQEMHAEGANPLDPDNFAKIDEAYKVYDTARSEIENDLKPRLARLQEIDGLAAPSAGTVIRPFNGAANPAHRRGPVSLGERFSASDLYQQAIKNGHMGTDDGFFSAMHAGLQRPVEVLSREELRAIMRAGGFNATTITGSGTNSAGEFVLPDMQPGVIGLPRQAPTLASVVTVGTTDSDTVEYVAQKARTNNAAETLETDPAAESAFTWETKTTAVEEITHFVPITRRAMADAGQVATLVESELLDGVTARLDSQMASGNGTPPNIRGIYNTSNVGNQDQSTDSQLDAIHKAMTVVRTAFYQSIEVDYIGINPTDEQTLRLAKDANGNYLFGNINSGDAVTPWGVPLLVSSIFTAGKPIVGAFRRGATLWIREGLTVNTGLNGDDFKYRRVSMLATERVAFAVVRPAAFCTVTFA